MKRAFDIVAAFLSLIVLSPLCVIVAAAVAATSPGSVIFRQERVGFKGKTFTILKFRTMADGSSRFGHRTSENDSRVTRVGRIMRRIHLDELPQLVNVLRGEMSLVGPRPLSIECVREMEAEVPGYRERFDAVPGMTGPIQILGRGAYQGPDRGFHIDIEYVRNRTFLLDFRILLGTIRAIFRLQGI